MPAIDSALSALTALAALLWRFYHPGEEKTLERKFFFFVFGAAFVYHAWKMVWLWTIRV